MTAQLSPTGVQKFFDNNGLPLAFGILTTYRAGTSTLQATYVDSTQTTQNTNPINLNFRGECSLWLDPTLTYKFALTDQFGNTIPGWPVDNIPGGFGAGQLSINLIPNPTNTFTLGDSTHSWAQLYLGVNAAPLLDLVSGNIGYYARTAAEVSAGVTPTNYSYPPGYVDRYGTNTTPGTTDMAAAFTAAGQVANKLGCVVRWGATAPYALNTAVNWTNIHGVTFNDESSGNASSNAGCSLVAGNNNGHTFDLTASNECTFNNFSVKTNTVSSAVPLTLFFCARPLAATGAGIHRFNNIKTSTTSTFKVVGYQYASEENTWFNCEIYNNQPGSIVLSWNSTNPQGWTSTFTTVASGSQSNVEHRVIACSLFNTGNSGSVNELCIQLENCSNFKCYGGLFANAHGLAYVSETGNQACDDISFRDMRGEVIGGGLQPQYGYYIANSAGINVAWTIDNCQSDSVNELVRFNTGVTMQALNIRNGSSATSGKTLSAYTLSDSVIETLQSGTVVGQAGGNVTNNLFIGARTNITLSGSSSSNLYSDVLGGVYGIDNDSFTSASTACTGALTVAVQWTVRMSPNGKMVTLALPATQGTTTAAASFAYGVVLPVQFRPSANLRQAVIVEDSGGTLNQLGQVVIVAATGAISVFKDIVGTANFTNGGVGGLPGLTEISWNL